MKTHRRVDVQIYAFLTSAIVGGEWSASRRGRFIPREIPPPPYLMDRMMGGPQNRFGRRGEEEISKPLQDSNSDPLVFKSVAGRYTDCAIRIPCNIVFIDVS
jgi:hypothetical protein